jgi:molybdopterin/thiamine biosynthesis adenylyltransferase
VDWTALEPERFEYEVAAMRGIGFDLDEHERQSTGRVVFRGEIEWRGQAISLTVVYPDTFPYFRPEVVAAGLALGRHQNPYEGHLCLLDRSTRAWNTTDTGAWLVAHQVPYLLDLIDAGGERLAAEEAPQGEPMSRYFRPRRGSVVFVDEPMLHLPRDVLTGAARIAIGRGETLEQVIRCCLTRVAGPTGAELARVAGPLAKRFDQESFAIRWARLPQLPPGGNEARDLLAAARQVERFQEPRWIRVRDGHIAVTAILVEEEIRQGETGDAWLFAVQTRGRGQQREEAYVARGERFAEADLSERIPALRGMQQRRVALAGLGALGAPVALELARAQVGELRMLDHDVVEAGTIVRWPYGVHAVGHPKAAVLAHTIEADFPYTAVKPLQARIGEISAPGTEMLKTELDGLDSDFLGGTDLLVDATAEIGVQHLLSRLAATRDLPQIYVWATEGGLGGAVARVVPGETGCWHCLQLHLDDGGIPLPPSDATGTRQPRGCGSPTFAATSFDALTIVAQAMRVIAGTLLGGRRDDASADVWICSQPPIAEGIGAPSWTGHELTIHASCPACTPPSP